MTGALALASSSAVAVAASQPVAHRAAVADVLPLSAAGVATTNAATSPNGSTTAAQSAPSVTSAPSATSATPFVAGTSAAAGVTVAEAPQAVTVPGVTPAVGSAPTVLSGSIAPGAPSSAGASAAPLRRVAVSTSPQLQSAIASARPGDWITLAGGTYTGPFNLFTSGTAAHPVVLTPATGAAVTLTASLPSPSCGASGPDDNRTIRVSRGASHWVIQGLAIKGGIMISSTGAAQTNNWITAEVNAGNWQARRAVPGRGTNSPNTAGSAAAYLSNLVHTTVMPSDDIQILNNVITGKGVFGRFGRYGVLDGNTVTSIACGTGPAIWLANYSDAWTIIRNNVSNVGPSSYSHFMQEGIRLGTASSYSLVTLNTVHDLPTIGRGITTDVDASWNTFTRNTVTNVDIGYNDEASGWGNVWDHNVANQTRTAAYSFRMMDGPLKAPSMNTSTNLDQVSCNISTSSPSGMQAGAMMNTTFTSNSFGTVSLNPRLQGYWGSAGNRWNGSASPPGATPANSTAGC